MPIKKVKMEDKRKHHHFLSLGIGDDGDDNDEHCIYPSVYILAVTNNSHFYERKMRMCTGCQLFEKFIRRSLKSQIRGCSHITSAGRGGRGGMANADHC